MLRRVASLASGLFLLVMAVAPQVCAAAENHYKLMPGDRLTVKVFGDEQLSGVFPVDTSGDITLPIAGEIKVAGLTLGMCQETIQKVLSQGYLVSPVVSVLVDEYRPVYVYGQVKTPGAYTYRPGMTTISAVVIAGGAGPANIEISPLVAGNDKIATDERVNLLSAKRLELEVRIASLEAMSQGHGEIDVSRLPPEASNALNRDELVNRESKLMEMELTNQRNELDALNQQALQFKDEHLALDDEFGVQSRLFQQLTKHVSELERLETSGIAKSSTLNEQRQLLAQTDGAFARVKTERSRNDIEMSALQMKISEHQNLFFKGLQQRLSEANNNLSEVAIQMAAALKARELRREVAETSGSQTMVSSYLIYRNVDGQQQTVQAKVTTPLEPGDIIEVKSSEAKTAAEPGASLIQPTRLQLPAKPAGPGDAGALFRRGDDSEQAGSDPKLNAGRAVRSVLPVSSRGTVQPATPKPVRGSIEFRFA